MTLIAAFKCHDGVVICADTQETTGSFRAPVDKISIRDAGNYELVVGGAGNLGGLIDDFTEGLESAVTEWKPGLDQQAIRLKIKKLMLAFNSNEVANYPAEPYDKQLEFIICLKEKNLPEIYLWRASGTGLTSITDYSLIGAGEAIYKAEVKQLHYPDIGMSQAVLLGVRLLQLAKNSMNSIGGDTHVIKVSESGMALEPPTKIRELEYRITGINEQISMLMLTCPDTDLDDDELIGVLEHFQQAVMDLRGYYKGGNRRRRITDQKPSDLQTSEGQR